MTLATAPPFLITRWIRPVGWMCSRISDIACSNSSIASSALRPSHGEAAAWAVLPKNSTSEALSAKRLPTAIRLSSDGCQERTTSVLRKAPAWSMKVFPTSISSAGVPISWIVPGSLLSNRVRLAATAAVAAAVAANRTRLDKRLPGTIQLIGTPAEEMLVGKTFMLQAGAFRSTDVVLSWHPSDDNLIAVGKRLALSASDVEFFGKTAHAAASPWLGRSALDAMELFEHAMSLMREHIHPTGRIHRVIKNGGAVANVIPDYSKVQVWLRDSTGSAVEEMIERMRKAAEGAAMATETKAKVTVLASVRNPISNEVLGRVMQKEFERVGPPTWEDRDLAFAKNLQKEVGLEPRGLSSELVPYGPGHGSTASSDIGVVSASAPLAELYVATRPIGTAAHHWAQTSCAAHPVGLKGMLTAEKVLAGSIVDLLGDAATVAAAKAEFAKSTKGKGWVSPLPPDAKPVVF